MIKFECLDWKQKFFLQVQVVRNGGSHIYHCCNRIPLLSQIWRPKENEKLDCFYEPRNVFDQFAIKAVDERGETMGHLSKEISRVTKYFLDQGISMHCKLASRHFPPLNFSSRGTRNQIRSGDQPTSNCASIKVTHPLSRVDSKSLHWTCRRKIDGRSHFQFCHDITSYGEHACIANTREKKEKSYHDQCHNQKSIHSWNVFW